MISKNISEERLAELRCAFDLFDTDKDGKVDPKEIAGSFSKMGQQLNEEDLKEIVEAILAKDEKYEFLPLDILFPYLNEEDCDRLFLMALDDEDMKNKIAIFAIFKTRIAE